MSSDALLIFSDVWKKYSRAEAFHRSIREDLSNFLYPNHNLGNKDEFWALKGANFALYPGQCIGLTGPNGAGKSTILKLIGQVTSPTSGVIQKTAKVAPLIEVGAGFHPDLTGRQNIYMNGTIIGMSLADIRKQMVSIVEFSELAEFIDAPVKKYSSGMYLKLAVAIAFHSPAKILLVDEILSVADELFRNKCLERIRCFCEAGGGVVLVSHDQRILDSVTDRAIRLVRGEIVS